MNIKQAHQTMQKLENDIPTFYAYLYNMLSDGDCHEFDLPPYDCVLLHVTVECDNIVSTHEHYDYYMDGSDPGQFDFSVSVAWYEKWLTGELKTDIVIAEFERRALNDQSARRLKAKESLKYMVKSMNKEDVVEVLEEVGCAL